MKNIFRIFSTDAKRLATNVVALVIVMGLSIIPALYAWFNILSNWDPYGTSATSQMKVAVYSMDNGYSIKSLSINIGENVVDGLKSNASIGWVFCDSREAALDGVYSGEYYAAIIIPADFTTNMMSFLSGNPEHPAIQYYENSKKNAIATKITGKVKQTVQQTVNTSFISTLTETVTKVGEGLAGSNITSVADMAIRITELSVQLDEYLIALDNLTLITDSMANVLGAAKDTIPDVQDTITGVSNSVGSMQMSVLAGSQTLNTMISLMNVSIRQASDALAHMQTTVDQLDAYAGLASDATMKELEAAMEAINVAMDAMDWDSITGFAKAQESYEALRKDMEQLSSDAEATQDKITALKKDIKQQMNICNKALSDIQDTLNYSIAPTLNETVQQIEASLITTQKILNSLDNELSGVEFAMGTYQEVLIQASANLQETKELVGTVQATLNKIAGALELISKDATYDDILELLTKEPEAIAKYVTSPVEMETDTIYEIDNYGSAMAPFYTVLALWVGALIMVALVHVKVAKMPDLKNVKGHQEFFGRYITFFLIGQAQTLITCLGVLLFVQIQCLHPLQFILASMVTSLVFTMIMYSLTVALGNVGQALAVIIMVIQVAGAGCTFPIEVLPKVFQTIYKWMPFYYAMNTLKGCVGGFYRNEYWINLLILLAFGVVFALFGLFFRKPFAKLNAAIEKSKEKSGLLL